VVKSAVSLRWRLTSGGALGASLIRGTRVRVDESGRADTPGSSPEPSSTLEALATAPVSPPPPPPPPPPSQFTPTKVRVCTLISPGFFEPSQSSMYAFGDGCPESQEALGACRPLSRIISSSNNGYDVELLSPETVNMQFDGLAKDLIDVTLRQIAGLDYSVIVHDTPARALYAARLASNPAPEVVAGCPTPSEGCDVIVAPVSRTSYREHCGKASCPLQDRESSSQGLPPPEVSACCVHFGVSWLRSSLVAVSIAPPVAPPLFVTQIKAMMGSDQLNIMSAILLGTLLVGHAVWLAEREAQPQSFRPKYAQGIDDGAWVSVITMTTVGYGDRAPVTGMGRCVMILWMMAALLLVSALTGSLTAGALKSAEAVVGVPNSAVDLQGLRICLPRGYAAWWLDIHPDQAKLELDPALRVVASGEDGGVGKCLSLLNTPVDDPLHVDVVLADSPTVAVYFASGNYPGLVASPSLIEAPYALAFPRRGMEGLETVLNASTLEWIQSTGKGRRAVPSYEARETTLRGPLVPSRARRHPRPPRLHHPSSVNSVEQGSCCHLPDSSLPTSFPSCTPFRPRDRSARTFPCRTRWREAARIGRRLTSLSFPTTSPTPPTAGTSIRHSPRP